MKEAHKTAGRFQSPVHTPRLLLWGYLFGSGLCLAGLIVLSVALGQVLRSATRGVYRVTFPGTQTLDLRKSGVYLGVAQPDEKVSSAFSQLSEMQVSLSELDTARFIPVQRTPGVQVQMAGGRRGMVLCQVEIPAAGKYLFNAAYPSGVRGPETAGFLLHEGVGQNRADIAAGTVVCLVLGGAGLYVLLRTRRAARASPPSPAAPIKKKK